MVRVPKRPLSITASAEYAPSMGVLLITAEDGYACPASGPGRAPPVRRRDSFPDRRPGVAQCGPVRERRPSIEARGTPRGAGRRPLPRTGLDTAAEVSERGSARSVFVCVSSIPRPWAGFHCGPYCLATV